MIEKQNNIHTAAAVTASERHVIFFFGLLFFLMELWKQCYLYFIVFDRHYQVWYLSWQLCSMPIYLCPLYLMTARRKTDRSSRHLQIIASFLADFGLLGGVCALIVHSGFTFPDHPLLTLHGYVWHILLIILSLYITVHGLSDRTKAGFFRTLPLFFLCAAIAELLNICFHTFGDCDMFYISPYHLSSQPVFREIDRMIGRIPGIAVYLAAVIFGAYLVHILLGTVRKP